MVIVSDHPEGGVQTSPPLCSCICVRAKKHVFFCVVCLHPFFESYASHGCLRYFVLIEFNVLQFIWDACSRQFISPKLLLGIGWNFDTTFPIVLLYPIKNFRFFGHILWEIWPSHYSWVVASKQLACRSLPEGAVQYAMPLHFLWENIVERSSRCPSRACPMPSGAMPLLLTQLHLHKISFWAAIFRCIQTRIPDDWLVQWCWNFNPSSMHVFLTTAKNFRIFLDVS